MMATRATAQLESHCKTFVLQLLQNIILMQLLKHSPGLFGPETQKVLLNVKLKDHGPNPAHHSNLIWAGTAALME